MTILKRNPAIASAGKTHFFDNSKLGTYTATIYKKGVNVILSEYAKA